MAATPQETLARYRKARWIANLLLEAGISNVEQAQVPEFRVIVLKLAETHIARWNAASDATWALVEELLVEDGVA